MTERMKDEHERREKMESLCIGFAVMSFGGFMALSYVAAIGCFEHWGLLAPLYYSGLYLGLTTPLIARFVRAARKEVEK